MSYYNSAFTSAKDLSKITITEGAKVDMPVKVPETKPITSEKGTLKEALMKSITSADRTKAKIQAKQIADTYTSLGVNEGCLVYITSPGKLTALTVNNDEIVIDKMAAGILPIWIKAIRFKETTASGLFGLY
jgi:hypothetical protein